jgi:4-amino-4-deoxy-L-arabinose transferase-like glycosyltransferase
MLAKGPIALVLVGLALGLWIAIVGRWRLVVQLPWLSGLIVFFAVVAPWYILAERATPGFLYYFLVHEHILRYVSHEYGDLYGAGRERPYGASWVFLFVSFLPWSVLCIVAMLRRFRGQRIWTTLRSDPWLTYALVWGLAPAVFFTMARQILVTYLVPGFAGLALATAVGLDRWMASESSGGLSRWLKWHVAAIGLAAVAGGVGAVIDGAPIALALTVPFSTACVLWLARHVLRNGSPERLAGVLGLTTVTALTATLFLVATKINDQNSSQAVLAQLYRDPAARQRPLITPMASENSAFFYVQAVHGGRFVCAGREGTHVVRERLGRNGNELFLFERKETVYLKPDLLARLQPVAETVYWIAYEEKPRQARAQP